MPGLAIAAIAVVVFLLTVWLGQRYLMYIPSGNVGRPDTAGLSSAEAVTLHTEDGLSLGAWFVPASGPARGAVIVFNGNAGNRSYRAPLAAAFVEAGYAVLLFDYRGFGGNPGSPSEPGLAADARAARAYVVGRPDVPPARLVYFGESLGTGVALTLAVQHQPAALVLRSPFTSAVDVARYHYPFLPVGWLLSDRYDSLGRIASVGAPVLFIAGERDTIVPASQTLALFEAAREPKELLTVPDADHNDRPLTAGASMLARAVAFADAAVGPQPLDDGVP